VLEAAFNECVAIAVQLASKKEDADEAAHVVSESASAPPTNSETAQELLPAASTAADVSAAASGTPTADGSNGEHAETQSTQSTAGGGSSGSHGGSGIGFHQTRSPAPWSRYSVENLENDAFSGAGLTFKILRAAVLTQPLLIEYFDTPFQLNFL
jgi:hypothetical protein